MLEADICISGGGQTTYELARVGVPTIGICFAENQLNNLKYGEKEGYLKFIGWYDDKSLLIKIVNGVKSLNFYKLVHMSRSGRKSVDGKGVLRILKYIKQ
jgi:spore coat polysaccharide biosynthesis predicted glycosyltransferase SpsG